jgi:hypothetical protein
MQPIINKSTIVQDSDSRYSQNNEKYTKLLFLYHKLFTAYRSTNKIPK